MKKVTKDRLKYLSLMLTGVSSKWQKWQKRPEFAIYNPKTRKREAPDAEKMLASLEMVYEQGILSALRAEQPEDYTYCMAAFLTLEENVRYRLKLKKHKSDTTSDDIVAELSEKLQEVIKSSTEEEEDSEKDLSEVVGYDYNEFVGFCHFCTKDPETARSKLDELLKQGEKIYVAARS